MGLGRDEGSPGRGGGGRVDGNGNTGVTAAEGTPEWARFGHEQRPRIAAGAQGEVMDAGFVADDRPVRREGVDVVQGHRGHPRRTELLPAPETHRDLRSEERRVGKSGYSKCS